MNSNWNRQYRFEAIRSDGRGFVIGGEKAYDGTTIHISFQFEKDISYCYNRAVFNFWNLSDEHFNILDDRSCECKLYAGYGNSMPMVFKGYVLNVKMSIDGGDRNTTVEIADTFGQMSDAYVSLSYSGSTFASVVVDKIAESLGVGAGISEQASIALSLTTLPEGYSAVGTATDALTSICNTCGLTWSVQDGVLQIVKSGEVKRNYRNLMSNSTGLIGIPERVYRSNSVSGVNDYNTRAEEIYGYRIRFLMDGILGIRDVIHLSSGFVEGDFFIYSLYVSGDNLSGDWSCTAECVEVTSADKIEDKTQVIT